MTSTHLRVVTFNIKHGQTADGSAVDVALTAKVCAGFRADLLALQEVDVGSPRSAGVDQPAVIAEACSMRGLFGFATRLAGGDYGNALLVRGDVVAHDNHPLPAAGGEPRAAIVAEVDVGGSALQVAATHLSFVTEEGLAQLAALLELLDPGRPCVLMGDLNLDPPEVQALVADAGFALAGGGPTFPADAPRARIDHVAVAGGLSINEVSVELTPASDHRALAVRVSSDG